MAENIVKRQHFVPRTYLKHFSKQVGEDYLINVLPRLETNEDKIFESNIQNICLQRHIYTLPGNTVEEKMLLEKFYSANYESQYDSIYSLLTDSNKKTLTSVERELIISTVVTMFYRTSRWITLHNDVMRRVLSQMFQMCKQTEKDYFIFENEKISISGKTLEQLLKEYSESNRPIQVISQLEIAMKLIDLRIKRDGLHISKLCDEKAEFITSDNPVIATNPYQSQTKPFDPNNILKLPLDSKHIFYLMPFSEKETQHIITRINLTGEMCQVEKLTDNYETMSLSERFIFGSNEGLKSYLKTKEITERTLPVNENNLTFKDFLDKGKELGLF